MNRSRFMCSLYNERPSLLDVVIDRVEEHQSLFNGVSHNYQASRIADLLDAIILDLAGVVAGHLRLTPHRDTTVDSRDIRHA